MSVHHVDQLDLFVPSKVTAEHVGTKAENIGRAFAREIIQWVYADVDRVEIILLGRLPNRFTGVIEKFSAGEVDELLKASGVDLGKVKKRSRRAKLIELVTAHYLSLIDEFMRSGNGGT